MRHLLFFFLICAGFASCSEDFLSQTLDIDPPAYEKQLVVHAFGSNLDSNFRITLTQNFGILENVPDSAWALPGAGVELWEDGQKKVTLSMVPNRREMYYAPVQPGFFQAGKMYELRAAHAGFETVTARQTMPQPVQVDSARFREKAGLDTDGSKLSAVDVYIKDQAGVENFYEIRITTFYPVIEYNFDSLGNPVLDTIGYQEFNVDPVDSDDPNARLTFSGGLAVTDRFFDGNAYKFAVRIYDYYRTNVRIRVRVRAITEEYYLWGISAKRKYDSEDFPFADPVTTYTNLDNGIGVFGLGYEQVFDVKW